MVDLGGLFGEDNAFRQLMIWGVGQQVIEALISPGLSVLTSLVNQGAVSINQGGSTVPLTPALLADLVVRGFMEAGPAADEAAKSGVSGDDLALMTKLAGDAPSTTDLVMAYRRKVLPLDSGSPDTPSLVTGIREGRLANKWIPMIEALGDVPIGVADAVDAVVEGQISRAAGEEIAYKNGISPENFAILYNTRGNPPAPSELLEMVRRGNIATGGTGPDVLSLTQGISEGATKDKWIPEFIKLLTVLPPEGRVTAMLRAGAISRDQAIGYYKRLGYDDTVAAGFAAEASHRKTSASKDLAKGDIEKLYADGAIDAATATSMLEGLGYTADECAYLLAIQDLHAATTVADAAVTRIRSYYIARKIDENSVVTALDSLGVPTKQRDKLISAWKIDRGSNVKLLTESQIVDAWNYTLLSQDEAISALTALGYTAYDAWVVLSIKNKGPLPNPPAPGPLPL